MTYVLLALAILCEVTATISLRLSDGFSKVIPAVIVVLGYGASFVFLAQVLNRGLEVGIAYAIWAAAGVTLIALIGALFLGDGLTMVQVAGLALVIAGVAAIELGGAHD